MDPIKIMAKDFSTRLGLLTISLEKFDSELNSKLYYINKDSEKLRFLAYLKDIVDSNYQKHAEKCPRPGNCAQDHSFEIALYSINQQYDDYHTRLGGIIFPEKPAMQFFTEGKYFDAFTAIRECIKEAKSSIVLVDNYVNSDTLAVFPGKEPSIELKIVTKNKCLTDAFKTAVKIYNKQYGNLKIGTSENYHDRFLIVDDREFYHIGASIKDVGNKVFMFTKIDDFDIMNLIRTKIFEDWHLALE